MFHLLLSLEKNKKTRYLAILIILIFLFTIIYWLNNINIKILHLLLYLKKHRKIRYIVISVILIFLFTIIYWSLGTNDNFSFNTSQTELSFLDALYFTLVTQTTIGYGDISPKSQLMRFITVCHIISLIITIIFFNL